MKHLKKFNEASFDRIEEFIKMADKIINLDKLSNKDILSELGDLCNELTFTSEEIQQVIDSGRISDPNKFLEIILDEILSEEEDLEGGKLNDQQVKLYSKIKLLLDTEYSDLSKGEVSQTFDYLLSDNIFNSKIFR